MFIFGLKDDDTKALISIIWQEYLVFLIVLSAMLFMGFCIGLNARILRVKFRALHIPLWGAVICNIALLYGYAVALRGHPVYNAFESFYLSI